MSDFFLASWHASSVLPKTKAKAWYETCSPLSLDLISNWCILFFDLLLVLLLLSLFLTSTTALHSRRQYRFMPTTWDLTLLPFRQRLCTAEREAICLSSTRSCSPKNLIPLPALCLPPPYFSRLHCILSSLTATGADGVAYPMQKRFPRPGIEVLLHIFNFSWSLHSFLSVWKSSSIILVHKMGEPHNTPSFRPRCLTHCSSSSAPLSLPTMSVSALVDLLWIKFFVFLIPF